MIKRGVEDNYWEQTTPGLGEGVGAGNDGLMSLCMPFPLGEAPRGGGKASSVCSIWARAVYEDRADSRRSQ